MNKWRNFLYKQSGGITLEAAVVLPIFICCLLALITMVRLASVDMALQAAASETTKVVATHMYPVDLLVNEAMNQLHINTILENANIAKEKLTQAEEFVDDYAAYIPAPIISLIKLQKEARDAAADRVGEEYDKFMENVINPAMKPVVWLFADQNMLHNERLFVKGVNLPSLIDRNKAFLGIELEYHFPIHLPFFKREIIIRKKAYERIWVGA
ncbi:pilus assembly protein [Paenibacillus sp. N1-5-1-14]|uniref:TadE/TadG family type IV pilus assembly protein n=1 Tax=Paenibacillus radicibacter TaxID=2972488 RepID=UPI002159ACCB|nr:TadE family protein [Paenibacillus radicibacter]MCR8641360.1 pilus assembly protein [Paenibacillus radicibacter]